MDQNVVAQLTPQLVSGAILALLLDMVPGVKTAWAKLEARQKQVYNLLLILVISVLFTVGPGLANGIWPVGWEWLMVPLSTFFVTLAGNQAAYVGTRYVTGSSNPRE